MERRVGPSAWRRAWTAFCAPLPSATIVMTAPTPMMMPNIVRNDRSLLARIAWSATWKISPRSLRWPGRRSLLPPRCGGLLGRRQVRARHPLLECGPDLRFGHTGRQLDGPAIRRGHGISAGRRSRIAFGGGIAPRGTATQRRAVAVGRCLLRLARRRELL